MEIYAASLDELEALIANQRRDLTFPKALEARLQEQRDNIWARRSIFTMLRGMLIYDLFEITDIFFLPHTAGLAAVLRLLVVSPMMLGIFFAYRRRLPFWLLEAAAAAITVMMMLQTLVVFWLNSGVNADVYLTAAVTILIVANLHFPIRFKVSFGTSLLLLGMFMLAVFTSVAPLPVKVMDTMFMMAAFQGTAVAKYKLEYFEREAFLRARRDEVLRDMAKAAAEHDALTGLANRRQLTQRMAAIWSETAGSGAPVAVVMVDVDCFKLYNDRYGHPAGDRCLKRVAGVLAAIMRGGGLPGGGLPGGGLPGGGLPGGGNLAIRYGGEEFLMLLPGLTLPEACQVAERVRRNIEVLAIPHENSQIARVVTASFGVMAGAAKDYSAEALIAEADAALYEAKRRGRNQVSPPPRTPEAPKLKLVIC
jgi:GGDEF domain-containing protein